MTARLRAPGLTRAGLFTVLGTLFCAAIIIAVREAYGFPVFADGKIATKAQNAILVLSLLIAPLWFLVGLGAFDYWFRWAVGKPTIPEDHSGHGATSWKDYFRVNTDHKVIADGYAAGGMPASFGNTLGAEQVDALAKYLSEVTKGG